MLIDAQSVTCCRFKGERGKEKGSCAESVRDFTWEVPDYLLFWLLLLYSGTVSRSNGPTERIQAMLLLDLGSSKLAYALGLLEVL